MFGCAGQAPGTAERSGPGDARPGAAPPGTPSGGGSAITTPEPGPPLLLTVHPDTQLQCPWQPPLGHGSAEKKDLKKTLE